MPAGQTAKLAQLRRYPWLGSLVLFVAYFAAGTIGLKLATVHSSASPVWPPTGIAIAGLVLLGLRAWPALLVGAFLFNWNLPSHDIPSSILIAGGNTMEGLAGAWVTLRWLNGKHAFHRVRNALAFAIGPGLLAPIISATMGVTTLAIIKGPDGLPFLPWKLYGVVWPTWWLGDVGGALVFTPAILAFAASSDRNALKRLLETIALLLAAASIGYLAFLNPAIGITQTLVAVLGLLAVVAWAALRFGPREITLTVVILALLAVWGTIHSAGPFLRPTENESLLLVQVFVIALSASALVMGGAAAERQATERPKAEHRAARRPIIAVALGILPLLLASLPVQAVLSDLQRTSQQHQDTVESETLAGAFQRALDDHAVRLGDAQAHFQSDESLNRSQFQEYVAQSRWLEGRGEVDAVSFDRIIPAGELAAFEAGVHQEPGLDLTTRAKFHVFPATAMNPHIVVDFIEPFAKNQQVWGYDVASNATRAASASAAIDSGKPVATPPVQLVQDGADGQGFLLLQAVYHGGDPGNVDGRRQAAFGFVVTVHRFPELAKAVVAGLGSSFTPYLVAVYDVGPATTETPNPVSQGATNLLTVASNGTTAEPPQAATSFVPVQVAGRAWILALTSAPGGLAETQSTAPWFVMLVGGILSTSFTLAAFAFESTARRARTIADDLTRTVQVQKVSLEEAQATAHLGSWEWDIPANKITWSDELYRLYGLKPQEFEATFEAFQKYLHPEDRDRVLAVIGQAMKDQQPFAFDHRLVRPSGEVLWLHGTGNVLVGPTGQPVRMSGTALDITTARVVEKERHETQERVLEMARLKEVDRFKTQFINMAAHELRTPLTPLRLQVHAMLINPASPPSPHQQTALGVMKRNLERLATLVEDLLTVARSQAGRLGIEPEPIDIGKVLAEAAEGFQAVAKERDVDLRLPPAFTIAVVADPKRISQVLSNLLSNAFKFTRKGGHIRIEVADDGMNVRLSVTDTGMGIAKQDLPRLFTPFVQVHDTAQITEPGSGLGLYICKQFIEMHGGTICAESLGKTKGSTFWFTLPKLAAAPALAPDAAPEKASGWNPDSLSQHDSAHEEMHT